MPLRKSLTPRRKGAKNAGSQCEPGAVRPRTVFPPEVKITQPFYLAATAVTQGQWKAVMDTEPWRGKDSVRPGADYPATYVSWDDADRFCRELSAKEGRTY